MRPQPRFYNVFSQGSIAGVLLHSGVGIPFSVGLGFHGWLFQHEEIESFHHRFPHTRGIFATDVWNGLTRLSPGEHWSETQAQWQGGLEIQGGDLGDCKYQKRERGMKHSSGQQKRFLRGKNVLENDIQKWTVKLLSNITYISSV